jgi:hypothetical protein
MNVLDVFLQPFASVTVRVYNPDAKPDKSSELAPLFHEYEYGDVPPVTEISIEPLADPLHVGATAFF